MLTFLVCTLTVTGICGTRDLISGFRMFARASAVSERQKLKLLSDTRDSVDILGSE